MQHLIELIEFETSQDILQIPSGHDESISQGLEEIREGNVINNRVVMDRIKTWSEK